MCLQLLVAGLTSRTDIDCAHETANEVKCASKQLKECQAQAQTNNNRERLFKIPITNVSRENYVQQSFSSSKIMY